VELNLRYKQADVAAGSSRMAGLGESEFFRMVLEGLRTAVYVVDRDGKTLFWNDGAERITGHLRQDVVGRVCGDNFLGETDSDNNNLTGALAPMATAIREDKAMEARVSLRHKTGHRIPIRLWTFPIRNAQGLVVGVAQSFEESIAVADWDRRHRKLAIYGCLDQASGVLNHGMVQAHLRENLGLFAEQPIPFSILCIQIDGLENIQVRDGPGANAAVLRVVGHTLENSLRPTDFLGRWQDNRFLAILTECSAAEIAAPSERLRRMVSASKIEWWGDLVPVTISLGGTSVRPGDTPEGMVERAEEALRKSVAQGGNRMMVNE
jgi:diguanylate cyclase (GGDEF)-like protein/PAS domain S-box-containing protein